MEVRFDDDDDLDRLETDPAFTGDWPPAVVKAFRKVMQFIRAAADERDFFAMRSLHFENGATYDVFGGDQFHHVALTATLVRQGLGDGGIACV